jgi:hypothetical protein
MRGETPLGEEVHGTLGWAYRHLVDWTLGKKDDTVMYENARRRMLSENMLSASGPDERKSDTAHLTRP